MPRSAEALPSVPRFVAAAPTRVRLRNNPTLRGRGFPALVHFGLARRTLGVDAFDVRLRSTHRAVAVRSREGCNDSVRLSGSRVALPTLSPTRRTPPSPLSPPHIRSRTGHHAGEAPCVHVAPVVCPPLCVTEGVTVLHGSKLCTAHMHVHGCSSKARVTVLKGVGDSVDCILRT